MHLGLVGEVDIDKSGFRWRLCRVSSEQSTEVSPLERWRIFMNTMGVLYIFADGGCTGRLVNKKGSYKNVTFFASYMTLFPSDKE